ALRGLPPTVAIEQFLSHGGRKSTVATATEIYHYLRLLYAKAGNQVCPQCGEPMTPQSPLDIAEALINAYDSRLIIMLAPQIRGRKGTHKDTIQKARKGGFEKIRIDGTIVRVKNLFAIGRYHEHEIEIVTAEFTPSALSPARIHEEINRALGLGKGELIVLAEDGTETFFSTKACCPTCRISLEEPDPRLFSFNSRHGACATCSGLGISNILAPDLLIADTTKTINEGALAPLADKALPPATRKNIREQITAAGIDLDTPIKKLTKAKRKTLFYGKKAFPGLLKMLESQPLKRKAGLEDYISQFYRETPCPDCEGTRLNDHARAVRINGKSITDLTKMTSGQLRSFLTGINFTRKQQIIATPILEELLPKLGLLEKAGLSYLSLDRSADTLSGGEAQRIRLAAQVASNLRGVAYVLDEPTIGLHPRDNQNLIGIMRELQQKGNSVIIVEHDEETIRHADYIIDLGTGGGTHGGNIVAAGTVSSIMATPGSITGAYLAGNKPGRAAASARSLKRCPAIKITGACAHNLHNITARFPVGRLTVVCGVSGSGKTTLVRDTLYKGMKKILGTYHGCLGAHRNLTGTEYCKRVVEIDQSPIGKTPRSVPATYVGFYDEIRKIFSMVPEAKIRGYSPARFSFNLSGGRCEKCLGQGKIKVAMSFLPDMLVDCDECGGSRFNEETLRVLFKGHTIAQVLAMTVEEACEFFTGIPTIHKPLSILNDMGLGYLSLGQQSPTLSGGEAQRIKIAAELCKSSHGKTLYILDEPTTGLHSADIEKLMVILQSLVDLGNTLIIIEHNMAVISQADNLIDLGPGGGDEGGTIVAEGPPRVVAFNSDTTSETARYLKKYFEKKSPEC
ncbi:MAG: excinuclease ABC subunit UvrA, partial [Deltaproteobacteria bacterium]|nr:excinuclease ABC subunit UvrA [Deltaproteobacteria bacterium]